LPTLFIKLHTDVVVANRCDELPIAATKLHTGVVKLPTVAIKLHTAVVIAYRNEVAYPLL
jgi:hypothetical protein